MNRAMTERRRANLYDYPQYYDLVFGSDWKAEFDFLQACFERYGPREVHRVFEPACGTGRLLYRLARAGYEVRGLDLNERAVRYCNDRLARHGYPESAFVADMTAFRLRPKANAAFNMINSFRHLQSERLAEKHLRCMGAALRKGGVYILGLHLTPLRGPAMDRESWSAMRGHLCVNTDMWTVERDLERRREKFGMTYDIHTPTRHFQLYDEIEFRTYQAPQFRALLKKVGQFEVAAVHDFAYDIEEPVELRPESEDVVFVLRKV